VVVRDAVRALLARSSAYASLPEEERRALAEEATKVAEHASTAQGGDGVRAIDFPEFVAGLVQGVFQSIVDASVQQMREYAKLLGEAARALEALDAAERGATEASARRELAKQRQQMLATMVLMGINRIVVTDGEIKAKVDFDVRPAEPKRDGPGDAKRPRKPRRRRDP
jgi:hypothetical protein